MGAHAANDEVLMAAMRDEATVAAGTPKPQVIPCSFKLHLFKLRLLYGLRKALGSCKCLDDERRISTLVIRSLQGSLTIEPIFEALHEAKALSDLDFVAEVFFAEDGAAVMRDLLVICCYGQTAGERDLPKHDSKYAARCFEQ